MIISSIPPKYPHVVSDAVKAQDLEVRYGEAVALCDVNISVPVGASLAVVGANGSGKSTLLGALAGLHKASAGATWVKDATPALVLQATEVDAGLPITVRDTVRLARYPSVGLFRRLSDGDKRIVSESLERMQADHLSNQPLHHLSGGQRQRVLMAQGLAQQSSVLLLDEPMTGLDVTSRRVVLDVITEETQADRTVVMTTHSLEDARACDLVLLLDTAQVAFGPPTTTLTEANLRRTFDHGVAYVGGELVVDDHHGHHHGH